MTHGDVETRLTALLADRLHVTVPAADTDLIATGILDSLKFAEFLVHLEEEFGLRVELEDLDLDAFRTIERIAGFLVQAIPRG